jgi:hypothetical protein
MTVPVQPVPEPLDRLVFDATELVYAYPPVIHDANKRVVYDIACPPDRPLAGEIVYTRWPAFQLPERVVPRRALEILESRPGIYDYAPAAGLPGAVEWHVNFADPRLFCGYGTSLFAQDEMMVAEHPALGALREALRASGRPAVTEDDTGPTPVLVAGVERRCRVATDVDPAAGRPRGLYGNEFGIASAEVVAAATTPLDPPTITNVIAMAAPAYGVGRYTRETIERILVTAYTAFRAAVAESGRLAPGAPVVVHTGYWGCGAFGGNRVLMTVLQLVAGAMAGVARVVFHTAGPVGASSLEEAVGVLAEDLATEGETATTEFLDRVAGLGFEWGMSNGT